MANEIPQEAIEAALNRAFENGHPRPDYLKEALREIVAADLQAALPALHAAWEKDRSESASAQGPLAVGAEDSSPSPRAGADPERRREAFAHCLAVAQSEQEKLAVLALSDAYAAERAAWLEEAKERLTSDEVISEGAAAVCKWLNPHVAGMDSEEERASMEEPFEEGLRAALTALGPKESIWDEEGRCRNCGGYGRAGENCDKCSGQPLPGPKEEGERCTCGRRPDAGWHERGCPLSTEPPDLNPAEGQGRR